MTLAELRAENSQLRDELKTRPAVNGIIDVRRKLELEKEEAVNKVKEDMKVSFDEVCLELKTVKSELSKIWEVLEIKDKQFEEQSQELEYTHQQGLTQDSNGTKDALIKKVTDFISKVAEMG